MSKKRSESEQDPSGTLSDEELKEIYGWVDSFQLSRPKKNISRDFSDGVLMAELCSEILPKSVDMHNYTPAFKTDTKIHNWLLLNKKVFKKIGFELEEDLIKQLSAAKPGIIEKVLLMLRRKFDAINHEKNKPEADQYYDYSQQSRTSPGRRPQVQGKAGGKTERKSGPVPEPDSVTKSLKHQTPIHKVKQPNKSIAQDFVPRILLEEKEQETKSLLETNAILQAKITRLEHLLHLKDLRIDDLQGRVEKTRPTGPNYSKYQDAQQYQHHY